MSKRHRRAEDREYHKPIEGDCMPSITEFSELDGQTVYGREAAGKDMERLEIQAVRIKSGNSEVQTKIAGNVIERDEITIDQCMDMLAAHGMDSDRMREIAEAYQEGRREEGTEQTWVVRDVSEFPEHTHTLYCEITLICGIAE